MTGGHSALVAALRQVDAGVPEAMLRLDATLAALPAAPDSLEYSASWGARPSPYRATYYWDTGRRGPSVVGQVCRAFLALMTEANVPVPEALAELLLAGALASEHVLQLVIGIDAAPTVEGTRFKLYTVLTPNPRPLVDDLLRAVDVPPPPAADLGAVYIIGLDFGPAGLDDAKLYFVMDPRRVCRTLRHPGPFLPLFRASRMVVYQHCLLHTAKRALYFHGGRQETMAAELARARVESPTADDLARRVEAMNAVIRGPRLEPWILSYRWHDGIVDRSRATLYFHPTGSPG